MLSTEIKDQLLKFFNWETIIRENLNMPHSPLRKRQRLLHKSQFRDKLYRDQGIRQKGTAPQDRPRFTFTQKRNQLKAPKAKPHFLRSPVKLRGTKSMPIFTRESQGRCYLTSSSSNMMMSRCHQSTAVIRWSP